MSVRAEAQPRDDGTHAVVSGVGPDFRFRLGAGQIGRMEHPTQLLWSVQGDAGSYLVQLLPHVVPPAAEAQPIDLLLSHFRWETAFLRERRGIAVDEESVAAFTHPEGTPVLTWMSRHPAAPESDDAQVSEPSVLATLYGAHATLLHQPDHLLHFSVTGLDRAAWSPHDLGVQALRVAFSYFPVGAPTLEQDLEVTPTFDSH